MKLISLNIEGARHRDRVNEFLEKENPDVICLQEVFVSDLHIFAKALRMYEVFAPMICAGRVEWEEAPFEVFGIGILSRTPTREVCTTYYQGSEEIAQRSVYHGDPDSYSRCTLFVTVEGVVIGTTHFTWSPNGEANAIQKVHLAAMLKILENKKDFVLCGDFNAPRGGEIFATLAQRYKDNIPAYYTTSIDKYLHRAGDLQLVVDGIFSTPDYSIHDVILRDGVSDHQAVVCTIFCKTYE
jgi:exonuclease III